MKDRNGNLPKGTLDIGTLSGHLWEAANILRGPVDAADLNAYIFPLLFFKRVSDVYDEEYAVALKESGGDVEFYTNRTVAHLMTEMLEPQPGESIYDPTCGSEGMLLSAVAHLKRRNKVLFINAVNEVTRERAQSFLTDGHIQHIVATYQTFDDEDSFARVVSNDEIREKSSNFSIPLYVRVDNGNGNGAAETISLKQAIANWQESSMALRESMEGLFEVLEKGLSADSSLVAGDRA